MEKVIVGFDGRDLSSDALALAKELTRIEGAELHVAVVLPRNPIPLEKEKYEKALADHFEELFAQAKEELQGAEFVAERLDDPSPSRALNDLAEREEADAVVLGSTHRGLLGRVSPGSVAERLLSGAPCAVLVAPRGYAGQEHEGFGTVGVGCDGGVESKLAIEAAAGLARKSDGTVRLIGVVPPLLPSLARMMGVAVNDPDFPHLLQEPAKMALEEGASAVGDTKVESELKFGEPALVLAQEGGELDLLVLGSRSYGPVRRALVGGVSAEVMRSAPCPVMVIPRSSE